MEKKYYCHFSSLYPKVSEKKNRWGSPCWIHQSLFCLQEANGNLVQNLWTHLCSMWSKVSKDYGNLCQLCFQMFKMILLYLHACILFPGVLWEHRGYTTAPFSHGLGEIVLTLLASVAQVPSTEAVLWYVSLGHVQPVGPTSTQEYRREKTIPKL